jgi:hypothetical protein
MAQSAGTACATRVGARSPQPRPRRWRGCHGHIGDSFVMRSSGRAWGWQRGGARQGGGRRGSPYGGATTRWLRQASTMVSWRCELPLVAVNECGGPEAWCGGGGVRGRPNLVTRRSEAGLTGDWNRRRCRCMIRSEKTGSGVRERTHGSWKSRGGGDLLRRVSAYARKGGE